MNGQFRTLIENAHMQFWTFASKITASSSDSNRTFNFTAVLYTALDLNLFRESEIPLNKSIFLRSIA